MANAPDPIRIQKFLGGVDYPATRDSLLAHAKDAGAGSDVLDALNHIPEKEYDGPTVEHLRPGARLRVRKRAREWR